MRRTVTLIVVGLLALIAGPREGIAVGMTFVVNESENAVNSGDGECADGDCTLRDAIFAANANDGADTITFTPEGDYQLPLTPLPEIDASDGITIDGSGVEVLIQGFELGAPSLAGLMFTTNVGVAARDIVVRNVTVGYFKRGVWVCAAKVAEECTFEVTGVTFENVDVLYNEVEGIFVHGTNIEDVSISGTNADENATGISVVANTDATNIALHDNTTTGPNSTTDGSIGVVALGDLQDVEINGNDVSGYFGTIAVVAYGGTTSDIAVSNNNVHDVTIIDGAIKVFVAALIDNMLIADNNVSRIGGTIEGTPRQGIRVTSPAAVDVRIQDNTIDTTVGDGIAIISSSANAEYLVQRNEITGAEDGIQLNGPVNATVSRNVLTSNDQLGIDLNSPADTPPGVTANDAGDTDSGPNGLLNFPVITGGSGQVIVGTTCASCKVELFVADKDPSGYGEGMTFLRDATASSAGEFSVLICGLALSANMAVTATATDPQGNTSEFSQNVLLVAPPDPCPTATPSSSPSPSGTPSITPSPTAAPGRKHGDTDCDGEVTGRDALILILDARGFPLLSRASGCPSIGTGSPRFGDVNCDGVVDELDALAILAWLAGVPYSIIECTPIGEEL